MSPTPTALQDAGVSVLDCEHKTPTARPTGHPYIAIPDIQGGRVLLDQARLISSADLTEWTRRTAPEKGDILVTRRGRVGDTAPVPDVPCAIGQNLVLLRADGTQVRPDYLRWAVRSPEWWGEVDRLLNVGAVFSSLNVKDIGRIRLSFPPLAEQQAIAEVLGALDDKIAASTRLAASADEYACVQFSELARSTRRGTLTYDDVAFVSGGGTPSTKAPEFWGGDINWATPTDVTGLVAPYLWSTERKITDPGLKSCASPLYPTGTILMTSRATVGAFALAQEPTSVNQGFITVQTRGSVPQMWLFHEMRYRVSEYLSWANGATFLELSRGNFKKLPVLLADDAAMQRFADSASTLHGLASRLTEENRTLAATRDALLPKLMSGEVRVRDAENAVERLT